MSARAEWLAASPLTAASLHDEQRLWAAIGIELRLRPQRGKGQSAA
jgi:exopolyphosphatase/guanosine-5'-triphosphate,3'-diphosphate pyrophosphatase